MTDAVKALLQREMEERVNVFERRSVRLWVRPIFHMQNGVFSNATSGRVVFGNDSSGRYCYNIQRGQAYHQVVVEFTGERRGKSGSVRTPRPTLNIGDYRSQGNPLRETACHG